MEKRVKIAQSQDPKLVLEASDSYIDDHTQSLYPDLVELTSSTYAISATVDQEIVGGIVSTKQYDTMHINSLGVSPDFRHARIGTNLLAGMEELATSLGCHTVSLSTLSYQALDFYKKSGYEIYGQLDDYPRYSVSKYLLYKRLSSYSPD